MLANVASGAAIAADVEDADPRADVPLSCAVSASTHPAPAARNTWSFEKYAPRASAFLTPTWDDDLVRARPESEDRAERGGGRHLGRERRERSKKPTAFVRDVDDAIRQALALLRSRALRVGRVRVRVRDPHPDPRKRLVSEGVPLAAGAPIVIRHCQTNQCLAVPGATVANDFGDEFEVAGHTASSAGVAFVMQGLATGKPARHDRQGAGGCQHVRHRRGGKVR